MRLALALLLALAVPSAAEVVSWHGTRETFHVQGLTLTLSAQETRPVIAVRAKGETPFVFRGAEGFSPASAQFQVVRVDPRDPNPQILFASNTGGAHCCAEFVLIEHVGTRWKAVELGPWDGDGLVRPETDVDGDGIVDLAFRDNRFLYAFDAYAWSWPPPLFLNVTGGRVVDVSRAPRYRAFFARDMAEAKKHCAGHANGACAAYVADAARVGRLDEAWTFMLASFRRDDNWDYPTRCKGRNRCKAPKDYPQALRWFLEDHGYIERGKQWDR